jgi:hypothetical protein
MHEQHPLQPLLQAIGDAGRPVGGKAPWAEHPPEGLLQHVGDVGRPQQQAGALVVLLQDLDHRRIVQQRPVEQQHHLAMEVHQGSLQAEPGSRGGHASRRRQQPPAAAPAAPARLSLPPLTLPHNARHDASC